MFDSFQFAKIFGIPVKVHWSFVLILLIIPFSLQGLGLGLREITFIVVLTVAVFFCVILHEFGHALTAKYFGVRTEDIILLPIGGVARLERLPEKPMQEMLVALAGPMVNLAIAIAFMPYFYFNSFSVFAQRMEFMLSLEKWTDIIPALLFLNLGLAVFNLIPAFPMDGGRVLRALISTKASRLTATKIAVRVGQFFALLFFAYGAMNNGIGLAIIGVFIFVAARQELENAKVEDILLHSKVAEVFHAKHSKLYLSDLMEVPFGYLKRVEEFNFLIFDDSDCVVGSLNEAAILKAVESDDLNAPIAVYVYRGFMPIVSLEDSLKSTLEKLYKYRHAVLPVVEDGVLLGVIDEYILNRFLDIQKKLKE